MERHRNIWDALRTHCFHISRVEGSLIEIWKYAIYNSDFIMLDCLLDNGYSLEGEGKYASPMLAYAASLGRLGMVDYLKFRGASVHNADNQCTTVMPLVLENLDADTVSDAKLDAIIEKLYADEPPYDDVSYYADFSEQAKNAGYPLSAARIASYTPVPLGDDAEDDAEEECGEVL